MGFYIRGMEMPKDRGIYLRIDEKGEVYVYNQYPTKLYKAIPVPPHGRLIDADALINALQELLDRRREDAEYTGFRGAVVSWDDAICYIKDAPIVIPASEEVNK